MQIFNRWQSQGKWKAGGAPRLVGLNMIKPNFSNPKKMMEGEMVPFFLWKWSPFQGICQFLLVFRGVLEGKVKVF